MFLHRHAVFGFPVAHSRSPFIHELFGRQCGIDLVYERIEAAPEAFAQKLDEFRSHGGRGANVTLPLKELGIVNTRPGQGTFDIDDARLLVPGRPEQSLIYRRMTRVGLGRMPHVGSNVVDEPAARLVHDWIKQLKADRPRRG